MFNKVAVLLFAIFFIGFFAFFYSQTNEDNDEDNTNVTTCISPGDEANLEGDGTSVKFKIKVCSSDEYVELRLVGDTTSIIGDTTSLVFLKNMPKIQFLIEEIKIGISSN